MGQKRKLEVRFLTVRPCPQCGCTHLALTFHELPQRAASGHTHVGKCPVNQRPLYAKPEPAVGK
jgi:hypothetical protein